MTHSLQNRPSYLTLQSQYKDEPEMFHKKKKKVNIYVKSYGSYKFFFEVNCKYIATEQTQNVSSCKDTLLAFHSESAEHIVLGQVALWVIGE